MLIYCTIIFYILIILYILVFCIYFTTSLHFLSTITGDIKNYIHKSIAYINTFISETFGSEIFFERP